MDYMLMLKSMYEFIENRVTEDIKGEIVSESVGFSHSHARMVFREATGETLARYITRRKLNHGAFQLVNSDKNITRIAGEYGFSSSDVFTRAFKREFGVNPREFKKRNTQVKGKLIVPGVFGPSVKGMERNIMERKIDKQQNSCILYGVPKVSYFENHEHTTFLSCLKSCLEYIGQKEPYTYLMAASGASFRIIWNEKFWDGGNVGILSMRENPMEPIIRTFEAAGREFSMLLKRDSFLDEDMKKVGFKDQRIKYGEKEDFIDLIKNEVNEGRPLVAFGVVGPPEAVIITGYKEDGEKLVGWSFFQDMPEFGGDIEKEECGYFVKEGWFDSPDTIGVMAIRDDLKEVDKGEIFEDILEYAKAIMSEEVVGERVGSHRAYRSWAESLKSREEFPQNMPLPMLMERLMCHIDALNMVTEGRWCAGDYLKRAGGCFKDKELFSEVGDLFLKEHELGKELAGLIGGFGMGEKQARSIGDQSIREKSAKIIEELSQIEKKILKMI